MTARKTASLVSRAKKKIEISVILSAFKRWDLLEKALLRISEQDYPSDKWELIVIDDANARENKEVVDRFSKKIKNCVFISQGHQGAAKARILGFERARGDIIAFTDEDTLPQTNWLSQIKKAFDEHPEAVGIEGKVITDESKPLFSNAPVNLHGGVYIGCNTHYRRAVIESFNYYDPEFYFWREDTNMAFKSLTKGPIVFVPDVVTYHPAKSIAPISVWKNLRHLKDDMLLFRRFPRKTISFLGKEWAKHSFMSSVAWILLLAGYFLLGWSGIIAGIVGYAGVRFLVTLRGRKCTIAEGLTFLFLSLARDMAYPAYFVYYFITVNVLHIPGYAPRTAQ
ncbi:MAG: glycosyltransferase family 2 protein [Candidatus Diapherotrites archaeon]|uniref:Glycosyltransferase family 2 protein n=1 Tax=Candidatus Iainarchaeum sp. TaxID=3101447 RepID=A0A8T4C7D9_9ARCH|nr:glycosyltransferase family 2 protein [Candidatus Diapherotrites archaeon]